jgi:DNA-binding LacI/PurR family transcriptional regulator
MNDTSKTATAHRPSRLQMADIARMAGVSTSTVSRALNGSELVNPETRTRIVELARSLNYSINAGAQNLRLGHNRTVALVVPFDAQTRQHLSDPFFLSLIGSVADALTEQGFDMLLSRLDANRLDGSMSLYESGRAIGVMLIGQWRHHDQLNEMAVRGMPMVVWGGQLPQQAYATVGSDNFEGGRLATRHLLEQGCRRIAFVGDPQLPEIGLRHAGYLRAHEELGLYADPALCRRVPFVTDEIRSDAERMARSGLGVDGVFASSDLAAMTVILALNRAGLRVPGDVRVVGYDDIVLAGHFHPALSTVAQPIDAAGQLLVQELLSQLQGHPPCSHLLPTPLMVRQSSVAD